MVAETNNFFELNFYPDYKIVLSSELNIHSEIEIFNASISWLKHKTETRKKLEKEVLSKVRLHLVSDHAMKHLLDRIPYQI